MCSIRKSWVSCTFVSVPPARSSTAPPPRVRRPRAASSEYFRFTSVQNTSETLSVAVRTTCRGRWGRPRRRGCRLATPRLRRSTSSDHSTPRRGTWRTRARDVSVSSCHSNPLKVSAKARGYIAYVFYFLKDTHTHNFIHLLKRQHNYTQKNESENLTNQQHKTLKCYLTQLTQWRHIMFSEAENFLQKFTFSIVNRNKRQWTVKHLHATAGHLLWLSFENFHKCSDNSIIQGFEVSRCQRTCF